MCLNPPLLLLTYSFLLYLLVLLFPFLFSGLPCKWQDIISLPFCMICLSACLAVIVVFWCCWSCRCVISAFLLLYVFRSQDSCGFIFAGVYFLAVCISFLFFWSLPRLIFRRILTLYSGLQYLFLWCPVFLCFLYVLGERLLFFNDPSFRSENRYAASLRPSLLA